MSKDSTKQRRVVLLPLLPRRTSGGERPRRPSQTVGIPANFPTGVLPGRHRN